MHVRRSSLFLAAALAALSMTYAHAATPEEKAVLAPFQTLLDGIGKRDHDMMRSALLPGGMITLTRADKSQQLHYDAFIEHIPATGTQKLEERIHDPLVKIDDNIAIIWAPYEFLVDGKVDHCGTDIAHLVKQNGKWLIAGIADNGRKECAPAK
ncbi:nuclear transport factor 2 family protein [Dyella sp. LX-66]|uniref:nuclear transport factor 2 family protein n=1 Tax=unclassified Dyella TaxID=2634549 RepID=UPI001BE0B351|nr:MULTISPECIES: nuclear transport factor 2 family protein [unclassified Dyella]MBT2115489.1 nuclear transport factor 2 family protein [Dyella sp. LX-1]MBT2139304.1 nuclear transport factor 2 family protein [Dyella sp. LX-66]